MFHPIGVLADGLRRPGAGSGKSVGGRIWVALARSEPWKNNGHAAANRFSAFKPALRAHKEHGPLTGGRKVGYVRTVEVDVCFGEGRGDFIARKATGTGYESRDAWDF